MIVLVRQEIEGRKSLPGIFSISPISKPLTDLARIPEKILFQILKPIELRIGDPWDPKEEYLNKVGFTGVGLKDHYMILSRYSIEHKQSIAELINLNNFSVEHVWVPDIDKIKKSEKCKKATISDAVITTVCCLCCWFIAPKLAPTALAGAAAGMAADRAMNYVPMPNY